ncbi:hypothetical protein QL285_034976 [Trifolium repens]|nr:hypothetical protein QL285_034976 [Trifolium repens]
MASPTYEFVAAAVYVETHAAPAVPHAIHSIKYQLSVPSCAPFRALRSKPCCSYFAIKSISSSQNFLLFLQILKSTHQRSILLGLYVAEFDASEYDSVHLHATPAHLHHMLK